MVLDTVMEMLPPPKLVPLAFNKALPDKLSVAAAILMFPPDTPDTSTAPPVLLPLESADPMIVKLPCAALNVTVPPTQLHAGRASPCMTPERLKLEFAPEAVMFKLGAETVPATFILPGMEVVPLDGSEPTTVTFKIPSLVKMPPESMFN